MPPRRPSLPLRLLSAAFLILCPATLLLNAQEPSPATSSAEDSATPLLELSAESPNPAEMDIPMTARTAIEEGNEAFARGDFDTARGAYEIARKIVPKNTLVLLNLGLTEFKRGRRDEAERFLFEALRDRIELPQAWLVLGLVYLDAHLYEKAMAAFAQVVLHEPRNARARNYLGVAIGQLGWFDGAEVELRKAIELDANYADANYNLAYFYLKRREPAVELARRHYLRALHLGADRDHQIEDRLRRPAAP